MSDDLTTEVTENVESPVLDASADAGNAPVAEGEKEVPVEQSDGQAEAAFQVPENDDDLKGKENDPQVVPIIQLRQELRERNSRLDSYKPWDSVVQTIGDPALAQSHYELVNAIHTPHAENPSGFTTRPFLERLEADSPGTIDQAFADMLTFQISDPTGQPSTVVRELYRSHGLDPDRIDEYRNIDTLRASSGVVTADELAKIDPKYHEAFKSLPRDAQEDLLAMREQSPSLVETHLRNAERAMASERFERQQLERDQREQQAQQQQAEQQINQAIETDILAKARSIHDSIHGNLAAQVTFSSDATQNAVQLAGVMSTLATLQNPQYRFVADSALKAVGIDTAGFDELANRLEVERARHIRFSQMGDTMQARTALANATQAEQLMLVRLNSWALKLAKANGERNQAAATQQSGQLAAASARFVPSGTAAVPTNGSSNPWENNPHPFNTPEYRQWNKQMDKQMGLTNGATMFGNS